MFAALNSFQTGGSILVNISEVFKTTLYTGNNATQTISNGINLSDKGGLVWTKSRNEVFDHYLADTARGVTKGLASNGTSAQNTDANGVTAFGATGYTIGDLANINSYSPRTYVSWTFREQAKFFDIVTYTGTGASNTISHNLGSTPGCIMFKRTDSTGSWFVYHNFDPSGYLILNSTAAFQTGPQIVSTVDATTFTLPNTANNNSGGAYVAYLFAHNAGGFVGGNSISCGSYTGNGSATGPIVTLGYQPQWLLTKRATGGTGNWSIVDSLRGIPTGSADAILYPNASDAEVSANAVDVSGTGFQITSSASYINNSGDTYIYIAINAS
jgi:hypothetical protein